MNLWKNWFESRFNGNFHRQLIILSGSSAWSQQQALRIVQSSNAKALWLGDPSFFTVRGYPLKQYQKLLGQECQVAVYDGHSGISPSGLLALSGTIKACGLMVLCIPHWDEWQNNMQFMRDNLISHGFSVQPSQFIQRWKTLIEKDETVTVYHEQKGIEILPQNFRVTSPPVESCDPFLTTEQKDTFERLTQQEDQTKQHIITARRGRGKSALLGLLASELSKQGHHVSLCTAHKLNAQSVLKHTQNPSDFEWLPPDSKKLREGTNVLLVDEVASLPVSLTLEILEHCNHFVLATTTEGYEGTGRGFHNKLLPKLKAKHPNLKQTRMETPIRFAPGDSLETHMDNVFLLNDDITRLETPLQPLESLTFKLIHSEQILAFEQLQDAVNILSFAHYQTTPEDIIRFIDSPDNVMAVLLNGHHLVAVAIICKEGNGKLAKLGPDIANGARRLKGHQFAQKLSLVTASDTLLDRYFWRINRIAVHPDVQNQQIGSEFLKRIQQFAGRRCVDTLCVSFGMTEGTQAFWLRNGFHPIYQGNTPDKSTGEVSLFMLKHLSPCILHSHKNLTSLYLSESEPVTEATSLPLCLDHYVLQTYKRRILDYVNTTRSYMHLGNALSVWLLQNNEQLESISGLRQEQTLLKAKWLQRCEEEKLQSEYKFKGRKQLYAELHNAFLRCYWAIATL